MPLTTSEITERLNRIRENQKLDPLSGSTVSVTVKDMRENNLLDVYRYVDGRPVQQVSSDDIEAALAKRDRLTAYWPAVAPEQVGGLDDRWDAGHKAFLARHAEKLFQDTFTLDDVFIPPLAYWTEIETIDDPKAKRGDPDRPHERARKSHRHVVDLLEELRTWIAKPNDVVRIVDGPPGAGKSSVARTFCAELIKGGAVRVLYVPLHELDPDGKPETELDRFATEHAYPSGVLDPDPALPPLLIVFDGLDELQQTDTEGKSLAYTFAAKYQPAIERCRERGRRVFALYCGRPIAAHHLKALFTDERQYFELLPFFTPDKDRPTQYGDGSFKYTISDPAVATLFARDRRDDWWRKFAKEPMPKTLKDDKLREFSVQPLLLTLLAMAYRDRLAKDSTAATHAPVLPNPFQGDRLPERMADVYAWLVRKVYLREWGTPTEHATTKPISFREFRSLLGLIGLAAWQTGDGRTATVPAVEALADAFGLRGLLNKYRQGFRKGTIGLFLSFFYRHVEKVNGVETFQFTIKPFAEHLAAVGLVELLATFDRRLGELKNPTDEYADERWTAAELASIWLVAAGASPLTPVLQDHVREEIARRAAQESADAAKWRVTVLALMQDVISNGFDLATIDAKISRFVSEQCGRAEYALLQLHGACHEAAPLPSIAKRTPSPEIMDRWNTVLDYYDISEWDKRLHEYREWINENVVCFVPLVWPTPKSAAAWLLRIRTPQDRWYSYESPPTPLYLRQFNLSDQWLVGVDLSYAILDGARLDGARLDGARLDEAILDGARLEGASLNGASLNGATLNGATLDRAFLARTSLEGATFFETKLKGTCLEGAALDGASLDGASLDGASLDGASLARAKLREVNFDHTRLVGASLVRANLFKARFIDARLERVDLKNASLLEATCDGLRLNEKMGYELLKLKGAINVPKPTH